VFVKDAPQHVLLKSIDELVLFKDEADYTEFIKILSETNQNHDVAIHSYVLMPDYFEFVATPAREEALPKFMQSLGRKYVWYYNKKYNRSGTLWEGRYKSSIVEAKRYLLDVMCYIEKHSPKAHKFNSVHKNLFLKKDSIVSSSPDYKELGFTDEQRQKRYSDFFYSTADEKKDSFIKECIEKQLVTGDAEYISKLEQIIGITLSSKNRGRPKKQNKEQRKNMYKNLVVLDKEKHKTLKINPIDNINFAKEMTFIPVLANEVNVIGNTFPVMFTVSNGVASMISLVSLGGESLAINSEGKWISGHIPSYIKKYPFSLASTSKNPEQKVILIDEESVFFSKSKGKQLFKKNGEQSDVLKSSIDFLKKYDKESTLTDNVAKVIYESGILDDSEIAVGKGEEKKVLVSGFKVVNREKLNALSDDILADWVRKGIISLIEAHIKSFENVQALFHLAKQRQS